MASHQHNSTEFFLVGFSDFPDLWVPLFLLFLFVYILTLVGNLILILLICSSSSLNTPMYFFLCNLSSLDIVYTSVTSPKLIHIFVTNDGRMSFVECILQLFFTVAFWNTEYILLTVMSYDRYIAICKPLHYTMIMNWGVCKIAATGTWLGGMLGSVSPTTVTSMATYHSSVTLNHFYCDIKALETVAIADVNIHKVILIHGLLFVMTSFILTLISYIYIANTICKIRSNRGKYKAFSTCASHLTVVSSFYILLFSLYFQPKSTTTHKHGKVLTVIILYIIPLLNPIVYSFRNKDVKQALTRMLRNNKHT